MFNILNIPPFINAMPITNNPTTDKLHALHAANENGHEANFSLNYVADHRARAHVTVQTGNQQRTPPEGADGKHASSAGAHGHSSQGQVAEGHAPSGQYLNSQSEDGTS